MKSIEMYNAPISVLENYTEMGLSGMSINDLSFLCGLIKKFKPKKIVEIGVAAGGSTTVILECLKLLNYKSEMYSVDICKRCYFKPEENSGFIAADYLKKHELDNIKHKFILGKTIASAVEEIGEKVDFVIIDTMHSLPGELLDFICVYPLMTGKNGGTVVFHDVGQCQIGFQNIHGAPFEYASLITMLAGGGIKYWGEDKDNIGSLGNIGAFYFTREEISTENIFRALFMPWNYLPDIDEENAYRECIKRRYSGELLSLFDRALLCNRFSLYRQGKISVNFNWLMNEFTNRVKNACHIYLYGAGEIAKEVYKYTQGLNIKVDALIVSNKEDVVGNDVVSFDKIVGKIEKSDLIILALDEKYHLDIMQKINNNKKSDNIFPHNGIGFREFMKIVREKNSFNAGKVMRSSYGYDIWINGIKRLES